MRVHCSSELAVALSGGRAVDGHAYAHLVEAGSDGVVEAQEAAQIEAAVYLGGDVGDGMSYFAAQYR